MTTKEVAKYLKLHEITIWKYAGSGQIPAIQIGRIWRFDKEAIDEWMSTGQVNLQDAKESKTNATSEPRRG